MTREEILKNFDIVDFRIPKKGDIILAIKNVGGQCEALEVTKDWKKVRCQLLQKK